MPNQLKLATQPYACGRAFTIVYQCPAGRTAIVKSAIGANTSDSNTGINAILATRRGGVVTQLTGGVQHNSSASINLLAGTLALEAGDELGAFTTAAGAMLVNTGPGLQSINVIAHGGGTLIASATGGLWRSADKGVSWSLVSSGIASTIAKIGSRWFAYNSATSARVSDDDGLTWTSQAVTNAPTLTYSIGGGVVKNGAVYAGLASTSQLTTTTDGITWTLATAFGTSDATALAVSGGYFIVGRSTSGAGFYRSTDGVVWTTHAASSVSITTNGIAANGTGTLIACTSSTTLVYSFDHGATWSTVSGGMANPTASSKPLWTGTVFVVPTSAGYAVSSTALPYSWSTSIDVKKSDGSDSWAILDTGPVFFDSADRYAAINQNCPFNAGFSVTASVMEVY